MCDQNLKIINALSGRPPKIAASTPLSLCEQTGRTAMQLQLSPLGGILPRSLVCNIGRVNHLRRPLPRPVSGSGLQHTALPSDSCCVECLLSERPTHVLTQTAILLVSQDGDESLEKKTEGQACADIEDRGGRQGWGRGGEARCPTAWGQGADLG